MKNAARLGDILQGELQGVRKDFPHLIKEVRGYGLMVGAEMTRDCDEVVKGLRDRKVLVNGTNATVLRFLPPLIIGEEHIRTTIGELRAVLSALT